MARGMTVALGPWREGRRSLWKITLVENILDGMQSRLDPDRQHGKPDPEHPGQKIYKFDRRAAEDALYEQLGPIVDALVDLLVPDLVDFIQTHAIVRGGDLKSEGSIDVTVDTGTGEGATTEDGRIL